MEVKTGLEKIILAFIFAVFILPEAIFCSSTLEDVSNSMKIIYIINFNGFLKVWKDFESPVQFQQQNL